MDITQVSISITMPEGACNASFVYPVGGTHPGIVMYPDGGGKRATFDVMAARVASYGYCVLVPDTYYRTPFTPFDMATAFGSESERTRLMALVSSITAEVIVADAQRYIEALCARPEVSSGGVGVAGYCLGGRTALTVAGYYPQVAAAASFHGGNLAVADNPTSPHHRAPDIRGEVLVAAAQHDGSFLQEQLELLASTLSAANVTHTIDIYEGLHGFAVPDNPTFNAEAAERHYAAMKELFGRTLQWQ